eukprot:4196151-Pyramimonas_sp.AAC.1
MSPFENSASLQDPPLERRPPRGLCHSGESVVLDMLRPAAPFKRKVVGIFITEKCPLRARLAFIRPSVRSPASVESVSQ